jgi:NAD(P)-dependent dehydrogenase (short-subunit alcohol dehydrogenase family)
VQGLGGLDIVVCNACRQQSKPSILDITTAEFDATMKTNIYAFCVPPVSVFIPIRPRLW